ncbi:Patatin-like phospholipase, partial [Globisporangium splendens]
MTAFDQVHSPAPASTTSAASASASKPPLRSFSFSGGGWLKMWMFGVGQALKDHSLDEDARFIGTSGGALVGVAMVLGGGDFRAIRDTTLALYIPQAHASPLGRFQMKSYLIDSMKRHANLHKFDELNKNPGKLTVVYSSLSAMKPRRASVFESEHHLQQTLIASCCATPFLGLPFKLKGEWVVDGGIFDYQPLFDDEHADAKSTITISPNIYSNADIRPSRYIPMAWSMFPPSKEDMAWLFDLGYEDGLRWIKSQGLMKTTQTEAALPLVVPNSAAKYTGNVAVLARHRYIEHKLVLLAKLLMQIGKWLALYVAIKFTLPMARDTRIFQSVPTRVGSAMQLPSLMAQWRVVTWLKSFLLSGTGSAGFASKGRALQRNLSSVPWLPSLAALLGRLETLAMLG